MKVLVIMGSPRKGNTFRACEELRNRVQKIHPVEFDYLWLRDVSLLPCRGCIACFSRGEEFCPNHDDAELIRQKIQEADGIVFASPVYGFGVTGPMKNFIDRFCYIMHRPQFFDKKAFLLTTTAFMGQKDVLKYLELVARSWGFEIAGKAGLVQSPGSLTPEKIKKNERVIAREAEKFAGALLRKNRKSPDFMDLMIFHIGRGTISQEKSDCVVDYQYWEKNGWLSRGARYFRDVPVNPLFSALGNVAEWFAANRVRNNQRAG